VTFPTVSRGGPGYPPLLTELHDPPTRLYLRGGPPEILARTSVAIVGARSCSPYGVQVARELARELAGAGVVVVSGLARGVDGEAHRGALAAGGLTVAVLGCGIDRDYPKAHAELARRISENGLVASEYPPGVEPSPWRFPVRNRRLLGAIPKPAWLRGSGVPGMPGMHAACVPRCVPRPGREARSNPGF
jgi:DNA processing protein